jgi:hypothetical protein
MVLPDITHQLAEVGVIAIDKDCARLIPNAYAAMLVALLIRRSRESGNPGNPAERGPGFLLPHISVKLRNQRK